MNRIIPGLILTIFLYQACNSPKTTSEETPAKTDSTATAEAGQDGPVEVTFTQAQYNIAGIQLGQPERRNISSTLKVNGTIDVPPNQRVTISVPYGGYVRNLDHDLLPGQRVRKGQLLAVLENPEFIQFQQDYLETKARLDYTDQEYLRQQELSRENVGALKIFQQTAAERQRLQAQLAGQAQRLAMLRINPATLRADKLTRTVPVLSPVDGYLTTVNINLGKFVNPSDVLAEITDIRHIHLALSVFERNIDQIRIGQRLRYAVGQEGRPVHPATIILIGKEISPERTIEVHVHPQSATASVIPGAYVSAELDITNQSVSALPEAAVVSFGGKSYVYVLVSKTGGQYHFRQVTVRPGIAENGYIAVSLPADVDPQKTPVVTKGAYSLLSKLNNQEEEE
ncbi:efflux RND transporter periplasmic adaptor subunit [Arsenicibacter rosenii]|uniref:Efflux transporter periplasmic adaptor subunit n=1 Tax=Arsenicibacter rosenii TaxID=1750698 RepID=A0A1S2VGR3_9BACT|nr:efflux RND transporter periplasmic adaptor subunit [Arsenicibacter rosenii]OIN57909.1 efflux transporter periplasmic adaptor subunit [Arsenicibacter rosenii]